MWLENNSIDCIQIKSQSFSGDIITAAAFADMDSTQKIYSRKKEGNMSFQGANYHRDTAGVSHPKRHQTTYSQDARDHVRGYRPDKKHILRHNSFLRENQHLLVWPWDVILLGGDQSET